MQRKPTVPDPRVRAYATLLGAGALAAFADRIEAQAARLRAGEPKPGRHAGALRDRITKARP